MTYKRLFPIDYNNKNFMIFMDENNRKTFLEINEAGEYEYPLLEDFKALNSIFNKNEPFICYDVPRFQFKEKVKVIKKGVVSLLVVVSMLNAMPTALAAELSTKEEKDELVISEEIKPLEQQLKYIPIQNTNDLNRLLGELTVTKEMVLDAIKNNSNLNDKYKKIATNLLNAIIKESPNYDLRVFYENIKDMKAIEYTIEEFRETFPDAKGAGAVYQGKINQITAIERVPIELLYHEMFHATRTFYTQRDDKIIYTTERSTALNEAMTNLGASLVIPVTESYEFSTAVLKYLLTTVDFNFEEYSKKGTDYLVEKLTSKYPGIDVNYISETLNAVNKNLIYQNKYVSADNCVDLMNELFKVCLTNCNAYDGYTPFNNFAKIFANSSDSKLIFNYLEKYNNQLKKVGYRGRIIQNWEALKKFEVYENAVGIGKTDNEFYAISKDENGKYKKTETNEPADLVNTAFDFPSLVSSTMFENYKGFGTSEYWKKIGVENGTFSVSQVQSVPIYLKDNLIATDINNVSIEVGLNENNQIGFRLIEQGNEIYATDSNMHYLSNSVPLTYYSFSLSRNITKIDLEDILNSDYLRVFESQYNLFKNIKVSGRNIEIEPIYKLNLVTYEGELKKITRYNITNCYITNNNGVLSFEESFKNIENSVSLKTILEYNNVIDKNTEAYQFSLDEIMTMAENYFQDLNKGMSR